MTKFIKIFIAITVSELAGVIGSIFTAPSVTGWYTTLAKPQLSPPNWVFAPVWTTLFFLMGLAAGIVWIKKGYRELFVFGVQLALNILWSVIFFGLYSPGWAFFEIIFLWLGILLNIILFSRVSKLASWLLLPYIIWVSFAAYLNLMLWLIN